MAFINPSFNFRVSTHSRTKAAAFFTVHMAPCSSVSTHSRTKAAATDWSFMPDWSEVSTHSRTKAAARYKLRLSTFIFCFNTQPHEGGCQSADVDIAPDGEVSTHSRTKAAAPYLKKQAKSAY